MDHRVQITRIVIACAVAIALLPLRTTLWHGAERALEIPSATIELVANDLVKERSDRICRWRD